MMAGTVHPRARIQPHPQCCSCSPKHTRLFFLFPPFFPYFSFPYPFPHFFFFLFLSFFPFLFVSFFLLLSFLGCLGFFSSFLSFRVFSLPPQLTAKSELSAFLAANAVVSCPTEAGPDRNPRSTGRRSPGLCPSEGPAAVPRGRRPGRVPAPKRGAHLPRGKAGLLTAPDSGPGACSSPAPGARQLPLPCSLPALGSSRKKPVGKY